MYQGITNANFFWLAILLLALYYGNELTVYEALIVLGLFNLSRRYYF